MGTCEESVEYSVPTKNIFELLDGEDEENILQLKPAKKQEKSKKEPKPQQRPPSSSQTKRGQQRISPNASRVSPPLKKESNEDQVVPGNDGVGDMRNEIQGRGGFANDGPMRGKYRVFTNQNRGGGVGGRYNNYRGGGRGYNNYRRGGYNGPPRMQNNGGQNNESGGFDGGWDDNDGKMEGKLDSDNRKDDLSELDGKIEENRNDNNDDETEKKEENDVTENEVKPIDSKPETITYEEYKAKMEAEKAKRVEKEFNVRKAGEGVAKSNEKLTMYRKPTKDEEDEEDEIIIIRKEPRTKPVDASLIKFQSTSRGSRGGFNVNNNYQNGNQNGNNRYGRPLMNNNYQTAYTGKTDGQREFNANVDMNADFPELQ